MDFSNVNAINDISQRIEAGIIESTGEKIQNLFMNAAKKSMEVIGKNNQKRKKSKKSKKWFDKECHDLKHNVRELGRKKHENPRNNFLRTKYHEKLKEFKRNCKSKRYHFWQSKFNDIENSLNDAKTFWDKWKKFSEVETPGKKSKIKGEEWYEHFSNLHSDERGNKIEVTPCNISKKGDISNEPFSKEEFIEVISKLKTKKAVGSDSICNEMIKNAPDSILKLLYDFINLCLRLSLIPRSWCRGLITPIFKDASTDDPNNYRGICISSALLKVICLLLQIRIQKHSDKFNLIDSNQIGFRRAHRTADHLLTLKAVVKKYVTIGKKKMFACFIDFKKAFDSVWHKGLFHKMSCNGITENFLNLIKDIYKKSECGVKVDGVSTEFFSFSKGVRQGCPLSPILFNMYINDIFDMANNGNKVDICLGEGKKVNALMYADDLIFLSDTEEGLQKLIDKLGDYCEKWRLEINVKKTKTMVFNRGNKLAKCCIKYNNKILENVKTFKYLGLSISSKNCNFNPTMDDLSVKANRALFALNNKYKISKLPMKLAIKLFNSLINTYPFIWFRGMGPFFRLRLSFMGSIEN